VHHVGILYGQFMMHGQRNIKLSGTDQFSANATPLAQFYWHVIPGILSTTSVIPAIGPTRSPVTGTSFFVLSLRPTGHYVNSEV